MGGGMTLGRRCSASDLTDRAGWAVPSPLCALGDDDGEADGDDGALVLIERGPELAATLTLAFLPLAECHALQ